MKPKDYTEIKKYILPWLRFNQDIYEEFVAQHVSQDTLWLDAGCGKHIFPSWREASERTLIDRARLALGCDVDHMSVQKHHTLSRLVAADLESLPFKDGCISLITCNMVVEHLDRPLAVFAEFARVLKEGGRVIVHTPNVCSHFVVCSRFIPRQWKLKLVKALDGRAEDDVFPTCYGANTPWRLRTFMAQAGLRQERCRLLASDATLGRVHPLLAALELLTSGSH